MSSSDPEFVKTVMTLWYSDQQLACDDKILIPMLHVLIINGINIFRLTYQKNGCWIIEKDQTNS